MSAAVDMQEVAAPPAPGADLGTLGVAVDSLRRKGPSWLQSLRAESMARAQSFGLPTRDSEEWRYTSVRQLAQLPYQLSRPGAGPQPGLSQPDLNAAATLRFIDGELDLTGSERRIPGVTFELIPAEREPEPEFLSIMTENVRSARDGLEALAAGLATTGVAIRVRQGVTLDAPIRIQFIHTRQRNAAAFVSPQVLVIAEANSNLQLIEDHVGEDDAPGLTLATTTLWAGENARLHHALLVRDGRAWTHFSTVRIRQQRASHVASHRVITGGALVRNNVWATIEDQGADLMLNGLFLPTGRQHHDNHMRVEHRAEHGTSRQYYRGLLADDASGVFTGRILVAPGAQKTDAVQNNANLLLSPTARVYSKPQLEIYADDVKCTHGAMSGQLDDEALFYMRSRGVPEMEARLLLLQAFAGQCIDRIEPEELRTWVRNEVNARLMGALRGRFLTMEGMTERIHHE